MGVPAAEEGQVRGAVPPASATAAASYKIPKCGAAHVSCAAQAAAGARAQHAPAAHAAHHPPAAAQADQQVDHPAVDMAGLVNCWYAAADCPEGDQCGRLHLSYGKCDHLTNTQLIPESNHKHDCRGAFQGENGPRPRHRGGAGQGEGEGGPEAKAAWIQLPGQRSPGPGPRRRSRSPRSPRRPPGRRLEERDLVRPPPTAVPTAVPAIPTAVPNKTEINNFLYLELLQLRHMQYSNRSKLRKIGMEQDRIASASRIERLKELNNVLLKCDKMLYWSKRHIRPDERVLVRKNLEHFLGLI